MMHFPWSRSYLFSSVAIFLVSVSIDFKSVKLKGPLVPYCSRLRRNLMEDKTLRKQKKIATKKLKILPNVLSQLKIEDLQIHFCDMGLLDVIADWLTPTSDDILPHLNIREGLINQLSEFSCISNVHLRGSPIAQVLRCLLKHEGETKEHKEKLRQILAAWSRSVFNLKDKYHKLTDDERDELSKIKKIKRGNQEKNPLQEQSYYYMPGYEDRLKKVQLCCTFREEVSQSQSNQRNSPNP